MDHTGGVGVAEAMAADAYNSKRRIKALYGVTAEALADAFEAEVTSRGIPPHPDYRQSRVDLAAGALARLALRCGRRDGE